MKSSVFKAKTNTQNIDGVRRKTFRNLLLLHKLLKTKTLKKQLFLKRFALVALFVLISSLQGFAQTYYSKVTLKLNGNNDIYNRGTIMVGGKVYVGTTAEEAESCTYEYSSERVQALESASHVYYLYAKADEGFEVAGFGATASATQSFNNAGANPYKITVTATSTDEDAPTEKFYYASFKYAADNKPNVCYANFTLVAMLAQDDGTGKFVNAESAEAGMLAVNYNPIESGDGENIADPVWHSGSTYASETQSKPYTSGTIYFPFTIFAKPNPGYEFVGWSSTSTTTNPSEKGTLVDGFSRWYSRSYTRTSVSNVNFPGSGGIENGPKTKRYYAVFKKLEQIDEPTGETPVKVTSVTGTTEIKEGSVSKNFSVDLVLNENLPYDKPGSDKNAKPSEVLKQFVTVTGANGKKSEVASYSLVYESTDHGEAGTSYSCHTIRLFFPYNIKADTYTVHLPYGLYTTVNGNKTPTYEFNLNVTADENPYLTVKSKFPTEDMIIKYVAASQTKEPDASKGEFEKSNITATVVFNEVVESIDESKKAGVVLTNSTVGVNYKPVSVIRDAAIFGKVSGAVSIAYPELVNGEYTLTIPAGLFVGSAKTNEEITVHFTVKGFDKVTLKPYVMTTDEITPKANNMLEKLQKLENITVSYKGEYGQAAAVVGNASGINVRRYTEVLEGEGEEIIPVRTYYDVETTPSVAVADGKMVVSFSPALLTGMYEVNIPAGMVANMSANGMTMAEKVNAGYAESPAYTMTFNVETPDLWVGEHEVKYATYDYSTHTQGTPETTTYTIVKEGDKYYLTGLLDAAAEPNKVLLDVVDDNTLTVNGGGFSNDDLTYNISRMSNDPINLVLGSDYKVNVPNKGIIYFYDEEDNMQMFVFGSNLAEDAPELNTVALVGSTPADEAVVTSLKNNKITLVYEKTFLGFDPAKDPMTACSLKDSEGNKIAITAVNHFNAEDAANEIDFKLAGPLALGTYTFTFDAGIMQGGNITTGIYTNASAEITFTVADEYAANLKVTSAKWGTFVAPFEVTMPAGVSAYTVETVTADVINLKEVTSGVVAANTPVVLYSEQAVNETYDGVITSYDEVGTQLVGVFKTTEMQAGSYILQNHDGNVAFYRVMEVSGAPTVAASRCYIVAPESSAKGLAISVDEATGINTIFGGEKVEIYDINGRKLNAPVKGINIINNKKVIIK